MIERRPILDIVTHLVLILGVAIIAFPLYVTFIASTQTAQEVAQAPMSLLPGSHFLENYRTVLIGEAANTPAVARMMRSEEHTSELQSLMRISDAVFCVK